jgi:hypothetical protein
VIAIGMWLVARIPKGVGLDRGMLLLEASAESVLGEGAGPKIFRGDERALLRSSGRGRPAEASRRRRGDFNGRGYDGPVLMIRSAQLGLRPRATSCRNRYNSLGDHCDIADVLTSRRDARRTTSSTTGAGAYRHRESPNGISIDGSQVGRRLPRRAGHRGHRRGNLPAATGARVPRRCTRRSRRRCCRCFRR